MLKLLILVGVSASGKSTYAKSLTEQGWIEINRDMKRFDVFCGGVEDWKLYKFTKEKENAVSLLCYEDFNKAVSVRHNVVVSDLNLKRKYHEYWSNLAEEAGYEFEVKYFPITLEEAWKRDERRPNSVGRNVINRQWKDWLEITNHPRYVPDENLPPCIVVDVDGTLAELCNRGPFEWSKVGQDKPRKHVIELINAYIDRYPSVAIVVVSGRDGVCEPETRQWLLENDILFDNLFMRAAGDQRKDSIIKDEILTNEVSKLYNVLFWVDDRPCVIRMLRDKGVNVFDVGRDYLEF